MKNRRSFLKTIGTGTALSALAFPTLGAAVQIVSGNIPVENSILFDSPKTEHMAVQDKKFPISFFTKPFDKYELEFMLETLVMAGVDGLDLTVRPDGRVEPEQVEAELPKVVDAARKYKLSTEMMVTSITGINSPFAEKILKTASEHGIKHYRMGYLDYDLKLGILESIKLHRNALPDLFKINQKYKIQAGYQNHTGDKVGSPMWDILDLMRDFPLENISSQFDIGHAKAEGAASWILSMHLLSKSVGSLAFKDFIWKIENGKAQLVCVPLGQGIVDFEDYFITLKDLGIVAPITLHMEYPFLGENEKNLSLPEKQKIIAAKIKHDVDFIRGNLQKFQLI